MNLKIGSNKKSNNSFEIVLDVKDKEGNPTGIKKTFSTDDSFKLHQFWIRNSGTNKKKKKKKTEAASTVREINDALKEIDNYVKIVRNKKGLEE